MKTIPLTRGCVTTVDDDDYEWLIQWKWHVNKCGNTLYAVRSSSKKGGGKSKTIYMHREILHPENGDLVDHINRNGLDNTRKNLRRCNKSQNAANCHISAEKSSGYRVVCRVKNESSKQFIAQIKHRDGNKYLGYYPSEVRAAEAYDSAAFHYHGEFARMNFED